MRTLSNYITEAIKIGRSSANISIYTCQPKDKEELEGIIEDRIRKEGPNCDLNDIDTSLITDMHALFVGSPFNGDISNWDVSNVEDMSMMFNGSAFSGDLNEWNVSNVEDMSEMFEECMFNGKIGDWDVSHVKNMKAMFYAAGYFNQDISKWKIRKTCNTTDMFRNAVIEEEFKPKALQQK